MSSPNNDTDTDDLNGLILQSHYIPEEVVALILSFVDANSLAFRCRRVCKMWKYLIDEDVWRIKLRSGQEQSISKLSPAERVNPKLPWYVYYAVIAWDPFEKNLLNNSCEHCKYSGVVIRLKKHGISKKIMNEFQPTITASEWYAGNSDHEVVHQLTVSLIGKNKEVITEQSSPKMIIKKWESHKWKKVELTFDNYGPGVRYILFDHEGKEDLFKNKMCGAVLKISLPKLSNPTSVRDVNFDSSSAQDDI